MNKKLMMQVLQEQLRGYLNEPDLAVTDVIKTREVVDSNVEMLGEAFLNEKYGGEENQESYKGFSAVRVDYLLHGKQASYKLGIKGIEAGGFTRGVCPKVIELADIQLEQPFEELFVVKEFDRLFTSEAPYLELQNHFPLMKPYLPGYVGCYHDQTANERYLVMELLHDMEYVNDCVNASQWDPALYDAALDGIAKLHSLFYGYEKHHERVGDWVVGPFATEQFVASSAFWKSLLTKLYERRPDVVSEKNYHFALQVIDEIPSWHQVLDQQEKTLIHADYNPRNIGFRRDGEAWRVIALDWECVRWGVPQYDLAQFVLYCFQPFEIVERAPALVDKMYERFIQHAGEAITYEVWWKGFEACVKRHLVDRASLLGLMFEVLPAGDPTIFFNLHRNASALLMSDLFK